MKKSVLIVPLDEIKLHFENKGRQDVKVVTPEVLTAELIAIIEAQGKESKAESLLEGNEWQHTLNNEPNLISESKEFSFSTPPQLNDGPFALSFANENAIQDEHYHKQHLEIYFSEHRLTARYRNLEEKVVHNFELRHGGVVVFMPGIIHKMELTGLTIVIEIPAIVNDKYKAQLEPVGG
jgi:hypothetical protein